MASTSLIIDRERGLGMSVSRLVTRLTEAVPEATPAAEAAAAEKSFPKLAAAILSHGRALLEIRDEMVGDAVFLHLFASATERMNDGEFGPVIMDSIEMLSGASSPAARRLRLLVRLYNIVPNEEGVKLAALVALLRLARENRILGRLHPFLKTVESIPARWGMEGRDARTLLAEAALAADALDDDALAQGLRIAHLRTLQKADPALLREAEPVAVAAARGFVRSPVASQRSNLAELDAVKALASSPDPGAAGLHRLLTIFSSGTVADLTAFEAEATGALAAAGVASDDAFAAMRLLTLASAASAAPSLTFDQVAEAIGVEPDAAERWVVRAMERGLVEGRIDQAARVVVVTRAAQRSLSDGDWAGLARRLDSWTAQVDGLVAAVRGGASAGRARAAASGSA